MKLFNYTLILGAVIVDMAWSAGFGDLAVFSAKEYFGGYVAKDASLEQCVTFLNSRGVSISLFDLMDQGRVVTKEDFARVAGQSKLLFLGDAEFQKGCIRKPLEVETWLDYCLLNDVALEPLWSRFATRTAGGQLPEVRRFFKK
jgi:hypothetical protein